jgi:hypothetical protein
VARWLWAAGGQACHRGSLGPSKTLLMGAPDVALGRDLAHLVETLRLMLQRLHQVL